MARDVKAKGKREAKRSASPLVEKSNLSQPCTGSVGKNREAVKEGSQGCSTKRSVVRNPWITGPSEGNRAAVTEAELNMMDDIVVKLCSVALFRAPSDCPVIQGLRTTLRFVLHPWLPSFTAARFFPTDPSRVCAHQRKRSRGTVWKARNP